VALTLTEVGQFTPAQSAGIATGIGFLIALICIGVGWWSLRSPRPNAFARSRKEWQQNLKWIKDALQRSVGNRSRDHHGPQGRYANN
jgi:hypothetical protein